MLPTRVHRDITNCMDTCGDFSAVISMVHSLRSSDENDQAKPLASTYNRYNQEGFRDATANAFDIKTGMSFNGTNLMELDILSTIKPAGATVSRKRKCPFESSKVQQKKKKRTPRTPIIIVPTEGTTMISKLNAKDIFEELNFVPAGKRKQGGLPREQDVLVLRRKNADINVPYRIVDNPAKLTSEEWERVVAVFINGRSWQFKSWPWNGNPTEIFSRICAFHIKFDDTKLDANVAKWNCKVLNLSKSKRHLDKAIFSTMWQAIEQYIVRNKPKLRW